MRKYLITLTPPLSVLKLRDQSIESHQPASSVTSTGTATAASAGLVVVLSRKVAELIS